MIARERETRGADCPSDLGLQPAHGRRRHRRRTTDVARARRQLRALREQAGGVRIGAAAAVARSADAPSSRDGRPAMCRRGASSLRRRHVAAAGVVVAVAAAFVLVIRGDERSRADVGRRAREGRSRAGCRRTAAVGRDRADRVGARRWRPATCSASSSRMPDRVTPPWWESTRARPSACTYRRTGTRFRSSPAPAPRCSRARSGWTTRRALSGCSRLLCDEADLRRAHPAGRSRAAGGGGRPEVIKTLGLPCREASVPGDEGAVAMTARRR